HLLGRQEVWNRLHRNSRQVAADADVHRLALLQGRRDRNDGNVLAVGAGDAVDNAEAADGEGDGAGAAPAFRDPVGPPFRRRLWTVRSPSTASSSSSSSSSSKSSKEGDCAFASSVVVNPVSKRKSKARRLPYKARGAKRVSLTMTSSHTPHRTKPMGDAVRMLLYITRPRNR
ncbi:hypothetical protein B296_00052993, partial [Ensete ventricosum]